MVPEETIENKMLDESDTSEEGDDFEEIIENTQ